MASFASNAREMNIKLDDQARERARQQKQTYQMTFIAKYIQARKIEESLWPTESREKKNIL